MKAYRTPCYVQVSQQVKLEIDNFYASSQNPFHSPLHSCEVLRHDNRGIDFWGSSFKTFKLLQLNIFCHCKTDEFHLTEIPFQL
jgi:hypothetical protein